MGFKEWMEGRRIRKQFKTLERIESKINNTKAYLQTQDRWKAHLKKQLKKHQSEFKMAMEKLTTDEVVLYGEWKGYIK